MLKCFRYKTYRVWPENDEQMYVLNLLSKNGDYDFWSKVSRVGLPVDIMVTPSNIDFFEKFMAINQLNSSILINNVAE